MKLDREGCSLAVEKLVDLYGLGQVLRQLESVCDGKKEHVLQNYQDEPLARLWARAAVRIDDVADWAESHGDVHFNV